MNTKDWKKTIEKITNVLSALKGLLDILKVIWGYLVLAIGAVATLVNFEIVKGFLIEHQILSKEVIDIIARNSNGILSILLFVALVVLIITVRKTGKKRIEANSDTYKIINKLHDNLIHRIRNGICELYVTKKKLEKFKENNNIDAMEELQLHTFDNLVNNLQSFVDLIAECLSKYNGDTISACIKIIDSGQDNVNNLEKKAKTLVRSGNTSRERKRVDESITVGENTDFKHLCDGTNIWYHGVDLKTKYENHQYETEADYNDWHLKYNSTIVVPIRYYNINDGTPINDILGFLCIDSKNIIENWDDVNSFELQYLAIFADSIYSYIKLFRRIFSER